MSSPDYIWRRSATADWLGANEARLADLTRGKFALIERPGRKRTLIEVPCSRGAADKLRSIFGGKIEKLQPWRAPAMKPLRVGRGLIIANAPGATRDALIIPAGAAFGTGEHATTAMSLRLLEEATRSLTSGWRMLDAGTGSGILALAGKRFGAGRVLAIDNDKLAISTAKQNARANRIRGARFVLGDVTKIDGSYDVVTANLYSDLLISILPRLRKTETLILSGVLRAQERSVTRALRVNGFRPKKIRRRGKWIALLVRSHLCSCLQS